MDKKLELYVKEANGKYKKYIPESPKYDNALYRRVGKKYVPYNMYMDTTHFTWQEGVFAVTKAPGSLTPNSWTSAEYLQKIFKLYKCSDIEEVSISKLGGMKKLTEHLANNWDKISGDNTYELAASIIAILMNYENNKNHD